MLVDLGHKKILEKNNLSFVGGFTCFYGSKLIFSRCNSSKLLLSTVSDSILFPLSGRVVDSGASLLILIKIHFQKIIGL